MTRATQNIHKKIHNFMPNDHNEIKNLIYIFLICVLLLTSELTGLQLHTVKLRVQSYFS